MLRSLVGSEMCIRDRVSTQSTGTQRRQTHHHPSPPMAHLVSQVSSAYPDQTRVREELGGLNALYPTLSASVSDYVGNDGMGQRIVMLSGTVPITYHAATYNIPIKMFVVNGYPRAPPVVYVDPTADMVIKPGHKHVGTDGMCYLPMLSVWHQNWNNSYQCNLSPVSYTHLTLPTKRIV
eukprot:TRINITY_DN2689_c0_g1_i2.p1 TRINITY_DN2689_c0_g1~~TRINITY_DN2689_c0_g1_i2.p1  ORF type:complete len:179 (-),score=39.24 TRINITY_DN2689_c0_g1_i2:142-678(-)